MTIPRTRFGFLGISALGLTIVASLAVAELPFSDDGNTINGCYAPSGALRLLTPTSSTCPAGFTPIQWNVTGPQGPGGPQGPQGPQGPPGISHAYFALNSHIVEGAPTQTPQEVVGLSDLPPGAYLIWVTLHVQGGKNDVICRLLQDGFPMEARYGVPHFPGMFPAKSALITTVSLVGTAPRPVRFTVECLDLIDWIGQLHPPIVDGTMIALPVTALN
jgi:hypothetical protein